MDKPRGAWAALDRAATVLLALETLVVAAISVGYAAYVLLDGIGSGLGWSLAALAAVMAAGLAAFTWGWVKDRRFALGGALTWQLMQGCIGVWVLGTRPGLGAALVATAAVVAAAVLRRHAALERSSQAEDPGA